MTTAISQRLHARSTSLLLSIENRLDRILYAWLAVAGLVSAARIASAPIAHGPVGLEAVIPYVLVTLAPFVSTVLALRWFRDGSAMAQPTMRLARFGQWRDVSASEARRYPLFGTSGLMVSLMLGMMVNVPVRALEFFTIMPPIPSSAPHWLLTLRFAMTLDLVLFSSLYMVAFVAALRRVPLFPRLLAAIWIGDLAMQSLIAKMVGAEDLPVAVADSLHDLLSGNIRKVLISVALWLPYLLLSKRVNATYRSRLPR